MYHPVIYHLFNTLFTFVPIVIFGVCDKKFGKRELLKNPEYYKAGSLNYYFNAKKY